MCEVEASELLLPIPDASVETDMRDQDQRSAGRAVLLAGGQFNVTTLALDAAVAGQGVVVACRAFVQHELADGRLMQVSKRILKAERSYYLVRKRQSRQGDATKAIWKWCLENLSATRHEGGVS